MEFTKIRFHHLIKSINQIEITIGKVQRRINFNIEGPDDIHFLPDKPFDQYEWVDGLLINGEDFNDYVENLQIFKDSFLDEVNENNNYALNKGGMNIYFDELIDELVKVNSQIVEEPGELKFDNKSITKNLNSEILKYTTELSGIFQYQKKVLRETITKLSSQKIGFSDFEEKKFTRIRFNDDINLLASLFYDLLDKGYITTTKTNLEKFIIASFTDKNGEPINKSTVNTYLKLGREEKRAQEDRRIIVRER